MAFKTDQIKLKEDYETEGDAGAPDDGTLALIGTTGSKELKFRDGGNWVAISGGGGTLTLSDLDDVASGPSTRHTVGVVNAAGKLQFSKLSVDNIHVDSINTSSDGWSNDDATLATTAKIQDWVEGKSYLTAETSHSDVLVDGDFGSPGLMTTDGAGNYSITANNFSTVDDLNDLSDVATPATLDATHVGKAVGVVSGGGTASVLTLDHSGIIDNFVTQNIYFEIAGQEYWIAYDSTNPISSDTSFTLQGSGIKRAMIDGSDVTNDGMGADIRTLMAVFNDGTESSAYTISGSGASMTMTANSVGAASNIVYPSTTGSNLESGMSVTQTEGVDAQYQYELINTSGASDPNWNHVQNSAWGGDLTIATNTASNLSWINTQNPGANELTIRQPSDYGAYTVITVMNASNSTMDISTVDNTFDFNCQQLNPTQVNTITLDAFQKAILVRTAGTDWDVVLASI